MKKKDEINKRSDRRGENISELEDLATEIIHNETHTHTNSKQQQQQKEQLISEQGDSKLIPKYTCDWSLKEQNKCFRKQ